MSLDERTNPQAAAEPVHEDFIPPSDWDRQENSDTLILMLPGFRKEQLKVQVSSNRVLRLRGERKISDNKWRRFHKEVILSDSHDTTGINAKFEAGMLYVKLPKFIKPPPQEPSTPHRPTSPTTDDDDHKPDATQQHDLEKDSKEDRTDEESKIEEQPTPVHEDSKVMLQKEMMSKAETEEKSEEMHETTETRVKEQKEGDEDCEKKVAESEIKRDNIDEKEMREVEASKGLEGLSRIISVGKMKTRLEKISEMVLEVKKQNKVANLVVLVFLVLLIGFYVKSVVKSSFAGPRNQHL